MPDPKPGEDVTSLMQIKSGDDVTNLMSNAPAQMEPSTISKFMHIPIVQRLLTGFSDADKEEMAKRGITGVQGPGLMEIPGVSAATQKIQHSIDPTESPFYTGARPLAAGLVKLIGGTIGAGFDPRTAGVRSGGYSAVPAEAPIAEDIPLPTAQPRYELPPAPPEIANPPRFIAGEAGVAENRPYTMDVGPINPSFGEQATVLPRELGEVTNVSPQYAATQGLSLGRPLTHTRTPAEAAMEALIPDRYKSEYQMIPEPSAPREYNIGDPNAPYQLPSAKKVPSIDELHEAAKQVFPAGDAPPINDVIKEATPESLPTPGAMKDINIPTSYMGSADQVLESRPITKPIVQLLRNQGWDKMQAFIGTNIRKLGDITEGLSNDQLVAFGKAAEGMDVPEAASIPGFEQRLTDYRALMDDIFKQAKVARGGQLGYIDDYVTHVQKLPDDLKSGIQSIFHYRQAKEAFKALFERKPIEGLPGTGEAAGIYDKGVGSIAESPYTKTRSADSLGLDYNVNNIGRMYIDSMAREINLRPAVEQATKIVEGLPDTKLKSLAEWYIKNITRFDSAPQLHEANQKFARLMIDTTGRSMMGLNHHLQMLHLMRLGPVWADLGTRYSAAGLSELVKNPSAAYEEAASLGLLPQEIYPWKFQTAGERTDSILNYKSAVDFVDRSIAFKGFQRKYLDAGMEPSVAKEMAISDAKRTTFTSDPSRAIMGLNPDYSMMGTIGRLMAQYKTVPAKIVEWAARTAMESKQNPAKAARMLALLGTAGTSAAIAGPEIFHMPTSLLDWTAASTNEMRKIVTYAWKGDVDKALTEAGLWITPAGKYLERLTGSQ